MEKINRNHSYGEAFKLSLVDRFGVWLSARQIKKWIPSLERKKLGDFGCGFNAVTARSFLDQVESVVLLDINLANDLKNNNKIHAIEGRLPESLDQIPRESLDVIIFNSVFEHLEEPFLTLQKLYSLLSANGILLINVPSWRGKRFLEFSAFKLGFSPASEMDDHKMYYDVSDLWPLLVRCGFKPSNINCFPHKFGLNTFACCRK